MADFYDLASDPYINQETGVLRNKFNISNQDELEDAESDITSLEITGLTVNGFPSLNLASIFTYKKIHKQLFGDIYEWAGNFRSINIEKDTTKFCEHRFIENEGNRILNELANDQSFGRRSINQRISLDWHITI